MSKRLLALALLWLLVGPLMAGAQTLSRFHAEAPAVMPVAGLDHHIQDGKLQLTLRDYLALVLANDTQIRVLLLANATAQNAVLAAHSPFDPNLTASFGSTRTLQPQTTQTSGATTLSQLGQITQIGFSQQLATGQQVQINFGSNRNSSNSLFSTFNPSIGANFGFSLTQPLLRNRSNLQNRTGTLVARTQLLVVGDQTQTQIADELVTAADQYWATVQARDEITVQQQALDLARKSYERDENALKLGALAPGDIFTSQAQVAQDQTQLLQAQSSYQQQVDLLRRLAGADLDPATRDLDVALLDDPSAEPPQAPLLSREQAVAEALRQRPEVDALQRQGAEDSFRLAQARDALKPQLNLTGSYGSNGLAGNSVGIVTPLGVSAAGTDTGLGTALHQIFAFASPTYGFSLSLSLPLRNSSAEAQLANSLISQTSDAYQQRTEEQQIRQEVLLADTRLRMAVEVVRSAGTARDLAQKNVDAEQQKYTLGSITVFELLQAQVQLSNAQLTLLNAYTSYQEAEIAYERATWTLFSKLGVRVE
ncbi:MAG TPA: TolC family protein [Terriglobales bacterium]|jgi:outer membrane protein TolC